MKYKLLLLALVVAFACFYFLKGCNTMPIVTRGVQEFNAAVAANPTILNNQTIAKVVLNSTHPTSGDGVVWENMVIHNLTLRDVKMHGAKLSNITFVDCTFIKADFDYSTLSNVKFIRGTMTGLDAPDSYEDYETSFQHVAIDRVLFDGVYFKKHAKFTFNGGEKGGIVVMRNITTGEDSTDVSRLLGGSNLHVRMDNCTVINQIALNIREGDNSAYITNSHFRNTKDQTVSTPARWDASLSLLGRASWVENCVIESGRIPATDVAVITNCTLGNISPGGREIPSTMFFSKNKFVKRHKDDGLRINGAQDRIDDVNSFYIYAGGETIPQRVVLGTGNIYIFDATIENMSSRQKRFNTALPNLNLQNVDIKSGKFEYAHWLNAKWENVRVFPPIEVGEATFGPILGYKVEFPKGTPWVDGTINITTVHEPLKIPRPPVPTLEETGLAQFWRENDFPVESY